MSLFGARSCAQICAQNCTVFGQWCIHGDTAAQCKRSWRLVRVLNIHYLPSRTRSTYCSCHCSCSKLRQNTRASGHFHRRSFGSRSYPVFPLQRAKYAYNSSGYCKYGAARQVAIQYVPAHCWVSVNECAVALAKVGAGKTQGYTSVTFDEAKTLTKAYQTANLQLQRP